MTREISEATRQGAFARDYVVSGKMQRPVVSIMSNIAEGFEHGGRSEFHQFLSTAKVSCAEVQSQLFMALDVRYLNKSAFDQLMQQAEEVARIIGGLRVSVQKQREERVR